MPLTTPPKRPRAASWPLIATAALTALVAMIISVHVLARTT